MFTTFGSKSIISEITQEYAENIPRYFWETLGKILEIVPRKFPGIDSKELFSGNSQEFTKIWSTFSQVILQRNSLKLIMKKFLGLGFMKYTRMGFEKFLGIGYKKFLGMG